MTSPLHAPASAGMPERSAPQRALPVRASRLGGYCWASHKRVRRTRPPDHTAVRGHEVGSSCHRALRRALARSTRTRVATDTRGANRWGLWWERALPWARPGLGSRGDREQGDGEQVSHGHTPRVNGNGITSLTRTRPVGPRHCSESPSTRQGLPCLGRPMNRPTNSRCGRRTVRGSFQPDRGSRPRGPTT